MKSSVSVFALFLTTLLMGLGVAHAADAPGAWWRGLDPTQRHAFVSGYLHGKTDAQIEIALDLPDIWTQGASCPKKCDRKCQDLCADSVSRFAGNKSQQIQQRRKALVAADIGQVIAGVDKFYADYRNQNIEIGDLIDVAIESINGSSEELITKRLEWFRKLYSKE